MGSIRVSIDHAARGRAGHDGTRLHGRRRGPVATIWNGFASPHPRAASWLWMVAHVDRRTRQSDWRHDLRRRDRARLAASSLDLGDWLAQWGGPPSWRHGSRVQFWWAHVAR